MQVIILLGGALFAIFYNLQNRWRFFEIMNSAINLNKINTFNMVLDFSKPTFGLFI